MIDDLLKAQRIVESDRLDTLLSRCERKLRRALAGFLYWARSERMLRVVRKHLEVRNAGAAMQLIDDQIASLSNVIPQLYTEIASEEAKCLDERLPRLIKADPEPLPFRVGVGFDPSQPRAASLIRASRLRFLTEFSQAQRDATRTALAGSLEAGEGTRAAARAFRGSIGLTRTQQQAVDNYRRLLEANSKEALNRELRDRRFDRTVANSIEAGDLLDESRIERMVERYRSNMIAARAETIARTESLTAMSEARNEAIEQMIEQTGIDRERVRRVWHSTKDKRTRDSHRAMQDQTVGMDEPFTSGAGNELWYPGDPNAPPADRINCRCVYSLTILEPDE